MHQHVVIVPREETMERLRRSAQDMDTPHDVVADLFAEVVTEEDGEKLTSSSNLWALAFLMVMPRIDLVADLMREYREFLAQIGILHRMPCPELGQEGVSH